VGKKNIVPNLASEEQVNEALARIAENKAEVEILEAEFNKGVAGLRRKLMNKAGNRYIQLMHDKRDIQEWSEAHKPVVFKTVRFIELAFGEIGFRKDPPSIEIKDEYFTVNELKKLGKKDMIKTTEKPIKTAMSRLSDQILKKVGAKRVQEDQFYYKLKEEKFK
jgi:phage host-nuclease inhibitor protein Gam